MRSAWAERSPSAALEPRRGCPKISPPPPRVIAAMFVGEIYDSIRGRIDAGKKSSPSPTGCCRGLNVSDVCATMREGETSTSAAENAG